MLIIVISNGLYIDSVIFLSNYETYELNKNTSLQIDAMDANISEFLSQRDLIFKYFKFFKRDPLRERTLAILDYYFHLLFSRRISTTF